MQSDAWGQAMHSFSTSEHCLPVWTTVINSNNKSMKHYDVWSCWISHNLVYIWIYLNLLLSFTYFLTWTDPISHSLFKHSWELSRCEQIMHIYLFHVSMCSFMMRETREFVRLTYQTWMRCCLQECEWPQSNLTGKSTPAWLIAAPWLRG